jgi:tetratricopeptide (TPR) repeat protein
LLLNEAGLTLKNIGKPKEAEELLKASIDLHVESNQIAYASVGYQNLADLQFRTGKLESGLESAKKALDAAEKAKFEVEIKNPKAYLAYIFHLLGKNKEADKEFRQADELQIRIEGIRLRTFAGFDMLTFSD